MTCNDARTLLHAYKDRELDLVRSLEIEKHLAGCPGCARALENHQAVSTAIHDTKFHYQPPAGLQQRVQFALRQTSEPKKALQSPRRRVSWPILAVAASLLVTGVFVDRLVRFGFRTSPETVVAQEVLDGHLRALMPGHLTDVESTDRHTVKPWFNGKLDYSPPVADYAAQGYPLSGGRLDSIHGRTVSVLIYHRAKHAIDAYVWPSTATVPVSVSAMQGYNMAHWSGAGFEWWLASDLNAAELETLANLLRSP